MKLIHKDTNFEAKIGDPVKSFRGELGKIAFFREPHKPSSEGKVSVTVEDFDSKRDEESYVGVWGLEWIEREDRKKQRNHNEWFRTVSLGGRKSCPSCKCKLPPGESIWSWFEYHNVRQHSILHFCRNCFPHQVKFHLKDHAKDCGCTITLVGYGGQKLPDWLTLNEPAQSK